MGSYGVIKEALLVKKNDSTGEYSVVQKLVPTTVNGMAIITIGGSGGFEYNGNSVSVNSVYHGGAFGFSEMSGGNIIVKVNMPGYDVNEFSGQARVQTVNGVGRCVICNPNIEYPSAPYTHLCLVVESPGSVFAEN